MALFAMIGANGYAASKVPAKTNTTQKEKTPVKGNATDAEGDKKSKTKKEKSSASTMPADDGVFFTLEDDPSFAHWSARVSVGGSIFDGDVFESNGKKLIPTSKYAPTAGLAIERTFNPIFGVAVQYNYFPYKANESHVQYKLKGQSHEVDAFLSVNLLNLFYHQRSQKWAWYLNGGLGVSFYNAEMTDKETGETYKDFTQGLGEMDLDHGRAMVIPVSTIVEYNMNKYLALGIKGEYRMHNKDNFEGSSLNMRKGNSNDAFEAVSLTLRYKFHFNEDYHVRNMTYNEGNDKADKALSRKIAELEAKLADLEAKDTCCLLANDALDKIKELENKIDSLQRPDTAVVIAKEIERIVPVEKIVKDTIRIKEVVLDQSLDRDQDGVPDVDDRCPDLKGDPDNFGCPRIKEKARRVFSQALRGIQFETDKDIIKPVSYEILQKVVQVLKENPTYNVEIIGHTDNRGGAEYNLDLSQRRAKAVAKFLENNGISKSRIKTAGYGLSKPIDTNDTVEGRARNRRVEFVVTENGQTQFDTEKNIQKSGISK